MEERLELIRDVVIGGRHKEIEELVLKAIEEGEDFNRIIGSALIPAMDTVGERFAKSEIYIPEMLVSALTMKKALGIIKPLLKDDESESKGTILMGTVRGDLHDIGKNLVIMMLEGAGFKVIDLGVDLTVERTVEKVRELKPDILGLSALLTTTMVEMQKVIEALEASDLRDSVKVIVGGAPVDAAYARKIGADGYGEDASEAVRLARSLIQSR